MRKSFQIISIPIEYNEIEVRSIGRMKSWIKSNEDILFEKLKGLRIGDYAQLSDQILINKISHINYDNFQYVCYSGGMKIGVFEFDNEDLIFAY